MYSIMALMGSLFSLWAFLTWFACGIFAAYVASEKNRCGFCWFCWGVLFGPIGLVAVVGLPVAADRTRISATKPQPSGLFGSVYRPLPADISDSKAPVNGKKPLHTWIAVFVLILLVLYFWKGL